MISPEGTRPIARRALLQCTGDDPVLAWQICPGPRPLRAGIAFYNQQHRSLAFLYGGYDPKVTCLSYTAWVLWHLGYPDQALRRIHETLTLVQDLSHPFSLALALVHAAVLHQLRREGQAAQERAEAVMATSNRTGVCAIQVGDGLCPAGLGAGRAGTEGGRDYPDAPGPSCLSGYWVRNRGRPSSLALLAEAYGKEGTGRRRTLLCWPRR